VCESDLDIDGLVEPIHLVQQLQKNTLHLTVGTGLRVETLGSNRINLILDTEKEGKTKERNQRRENKNK
jgi:hypothetical protein